MVFPVPKGPAVIDTSARRLRRDEKVQVMINLEELQAVESWRSANRFDSRAEAARSLILRGLRESDRLTDQAIVRAIPVRRRQRP